MLGARRETLGLALPSLQGDGRVYWEKRGIDGEFRDYCPTQTYPCTGCCQSRNITSCLNPNFFSLLLWGTLLGQASQGTSSTGDFPPAGLKVPSPLPYHLYVGGNLVGKFSWTSTSPTAVLCSWTEHPILRPVLTVC